MRILFIIALLSTVITSATAQTIVTDSLIVSVSKESLEASFERPLRNGIKGYKIIYNTVDAKGNKTIASGALIVPDIAGEFPIVSYQHGTVHIKEAVPSRFNGNADLGYFLAGMGYITLMPDYIGMGDSPGFHPYVHAKSEATATIDLILGARELLKEQSATYNEQLFLVGYSQGGHATMAAHKEIEDNYSDKLTVTASAPLSGPYDISGVMAEKITDTAYYASPNYMPYVLWGYQEAYGNIFNDPSEILKSPYDETIPKLMDGKHNGTQISVALPNIPNQALQPDFLKDFIENENNPLRLAVKENDLYDWKPTAPIKMCYCKGDEMVPYENAIVAEKQFKANGVTNAKALKVGETEGHIACFMPSFSAAIRWFEAFR